MGDRGAVKIVLQIMNGIREINRLDPKEPIQQYIDQRTQAIHVQGDNRTTGALDRLLAKLAPQLTEGGSGDGTDESASGDKQ